MTTPWKAQLAAPNDDEDSGEETDEYDFNVDKYPVGIEKLVRAQRKEREGSSDEDDVPHMELRKRLNRRPKVEKSE